MIAEATMAESHAPVQPHPLVIGTAMSQDRHHGLDLLDGDHRPVEANDAADAAHGLPILDSRPLGHE